MKKNDVPQVDSTQETVAYAIKNWKKAAALVIVFTFCVLTIVGSILFMVKKSDVKVTTPVINIEKK